LWIPVPTKSAATWLLESFNDIMQEKKTEVVDITFEDYNVTEWNWVQDFINYYKGKYTNIDQINNTFLV